MKQVYLIIIALLVVSVFIMLGYQVENYPLTRMRIGNVTIMNDATFFSVSIYSEKASNVTVVEEVNGAIVLERREELNAFEEKTISFNASLQKGENTVMVMAYYNDAEYNGYGSKVNPYYVFFKVVA